MKTFICERSRAVFSAKEFVLKLYGLHMESLGQLNFICRNFWVNFTLRVESVCVRCAELRIYCRQCASQKVVA